MIKKGLSVCRDISSRPSRIVILLLPGAICNKNYTCIARGWSVQCGRVFDFLTIVRVQIRTIVLYAQVYFST